MSDFVEGSQEVEGPQEVPVLWSPAQQDPNAGYLLYNVVTTYDEVTGVAGLPSGGQDDALRIVRLFKPVKVKIVRWVVQCLRPLGLKPRLPHWDTGDPNDVLQRKIVQPTNPVLQEDGSTFFWHVEGEYHYLLRNPNVIQLNTAGTPAVVASPESFTLNEGDFSHDVIRASGGAPQISGGLPDGAKIR